MTEQDKQLLLVDLCARLLYEPWVWFKENWDTNPNFKGVQSLLRLYHLEYIMKDMDITLKPYLRPMSSMTEAEKEKYCNLQDIFLCSNQYPVTNAYELFDWLNTHHFDYRGLIEKGLALEAPKGMYNN